MVGQSRLLFDLQRDVERGKERRLGELDLDVDLVCRARMQLDLAHHARSGEKRRG
jgi:hypothetical protein